MNSLWLHTLGARYRVDLVRRVAWIEAEDSKNGEPIGVYLNRDAAQVFREQVGKHLVFVFTYRGKPVKQTSTKAWYAALERAGIDDFRWHDWRHTWAGWHVQNGTPLYALQEQGAWQNSSMVRRYAHLNAGHFAQHGEKIAMGTK
jgi:integrase